MKPNTSRYTMEYWYMYLGDFAVHEIISMVLIMIWRQWRQNWYHCSWFSRLISCQQLVKPLKLLWIASPNYLIQNAGVCDCLVITKLLVPQLSAYIALWTVVNDTRYMQHNDLMNSTHSWWLTLHFILGSNCMWCISPYVYTFSRMISGRKYFPTEILWDTVVDVMEFFIF